MGWMPIRLDKPRHLIFPIVGIMTEFPSTATSNTRNAIVLYLERYRGLSFAPPYLYLRYIDFKAYMRTDSCGSCNQWLWLIWDFNSRRHVSYETVSVSSRARKWLCTYLQHPAMRLTVSNWTGMSFSFWLTVRYIVYMWVVIQYKPIEVNLYLISNGI